MNIKERSNTIKKDIPAVFLALKDKKTPIAAKVLAAVTVGYALPIVFVWVVLILIIIKIILK